MLVSKSGAIIYLLLIIKLSIPELRILKIKCRVDVSVRWGRTKQTLIVENSSRISFVSHIEHARSTNYAALVHWLIMSTLLISTMTDKWSRSLPVSASTNSKLMISLRSMVFHHLSLSIFSSFLRC